MNVKTNTVRQQTNDRRKIIIHNKIGKQIQKRNKSFAYCRIDKNNDINERETRKTESKSKNRKKETNTK